MDPTPRPSAGRGEPDAALHSVLRLCLVEGVGPRVQQTLVERFGSAAGVLAASPSELLATPGVGPKLARNLAQAREIDVDVELTLCRQHRVQLIARESSAYPRMLKETADPPSLLYVRGELVEADGLALAVVGSRRATHYGLRQSERLAGGLSRAGLTVVSGLARGIDAAAHRAALAAGGRTIAVLGCGLSHIYPPEHASLADEVAGRGALVTEMPMRREPRGGFFPQRNRIISGMSLGVLVVEASLKSGALITARHAMEQGRDVFAVPGPIDNPNSRGTNRLIADGAKLVQSVDDILDELGPLVEATPGPGERTVHHPGELQLNDLERRVLDLIETGPTDVNGVIASSGLPTQQVLSILTVLEMRRLVNRLSANVFSRR